MTKRRSDGLQVGVVGQVLPPMTFQAGEPLPKGLHTITVDGFYPENGFAADGSPVPSDHHMARCVYPDGYTKEHQVNTVGELLPKVLNQLRGRYGPMDIQIVNTPPDLEAGAAIEVEVS